MTRRLLLGGALCLLVACRNQGSEDTVEPESLVVPVAATAARLGSVRATLHVSGIITPAPGAEFIAYAPDPARVIEVTRNQGDGVTSGELLVRLEIPSLAGELTRERAELARVQAELERARVAQTRARGFAERGMIARREVEDADRALTEAQSAVTRAEASVTRAEAAAARALIRAPFTGVIASRLHNPGDLVQGSVTDPILRLVDPTRVEVTASVPAAEASRVLPGSTGRLIGGGEPAPLPLQVAAVSGRTEAGASGLATVRLTLSAATALAVDSPVQVDIDLGERSGVVLVPPEAVVRGGQRATVFVIADGLAQRREVTTGIEDDTGVEVTDGVKAGELVITRGHTGLETGTPVNAVVAP